MESIEFLKNMLYGFKCEFQKVTDVLLSYLQLERCEKRCCYPCVYSFNTCFSSGGA